MLNLTGMTRPARRGLVAVLGASVLGALTAVPTPATAGGSPAIVAAVDDPGVLGGDSWLRHHREDLMPYWDRPEALGEPLGNFPSFRGRDGELLPESPESTETT